MEQKRVLLVNDLPGYGKVALAGMMSVLSRMGYEVLNLPTALLSSTLDLGKYEILDTTAYMRGCLRVWEELGITHDAICTGFVLSEEQNSLVEELCRRGREKGEKIFVDPIMGDGGRLYNGMTGQTVERMKGLCAWADVAIPNMTEAAFLADCYRGQPQVEAYQLREMAERICGLGARAVVITSAVVGGKSQVYGYEKESGKSFSVPYEQIPLRLPGTGDLFAAFLAGCCLRGMSLEGCVRKTVNILERLILADQKAGGGCKGIPVERYWEELGV